MCRLFVYVYRECTNMYQHVDTPLWSTNEDLRAKHRKQYRRQQRLRWVQQVYSLPLLCWCRQTRVLPIKTGLSVLSAVRLGTLQVDTLGVHSSMCLTHWWGSRATKCCSSGLTSAALSSCHPLCPSALCVQPSRTSPTRYPHIVRRAAYVTDWALLTKQTQFTRIHVHTLPLTQCRQTYSEAAPKASEVSYIT